MNNLNALDWITLILVIIGAVNWGLAGLFRFNAVRAILGRTSMARAIYTLVGLSGLYVIYLSTQLART